MILRQKRDSEAFVREKDIDSMKANQYLINNDIVLIASGDEAYSFYTILETSDDVNKISLNNGLFAVLIPDPKRYTKEEINKLFPTKSTNIVLGSGLSGGGNLENNIEINLDPLTNEELKGILNFETINKEFFLASEKDIKNLFYNIKNISDLSYKLGIIDQDVNKIVNMKLLSLYNDLQLQKNKELNKELKNEIASDVSSKVSTAKSELETKINTKLNSSDFDTFKNQNIANLNLKADKNINVTAGTGLLGGGSLENNISLNLDPLTEPEIREILKKYIKGEK